jgi:hypothetical protein
MPHKYEIYQRSEGQHRQGQFALRIDGVEADYTCDPSQFMPKTLVEENGDPVRALAASEDYAKIALQRVVDRLIKGSRAPAGIPMREGEFDTAAIKAEAAPSRAGKLSRRAKEDEAVARFLSRGRLSVDILDNKGRVVRRRPLNDEERAARNKRRDNRRDNQEDWKTRRKALIARVSKQIEMAEKEIKELPQGDQAYSDEVMNRANKLERRLRSLVAEKAALEVGVLAASHGFQYAYGQYLTKQVSLSADDIRIVPCMTSTDADTLRDAVDTCSDLALDEFDGANYTTGGLALDSQAVNIDDANDRAEFDAADEQVLALGAGTRSIQGLLLISFITNLNSSLPLHWLEFSSNKTPDGSDFTFAFNAEGILQMADG